MDVKDVIEEIAKYYEENTSEDLERIISIIDSEEANDRFGWCDDAKYREALVWCDYEELPEFVATIVYYAKINIRELIWAFVLIHRKEEKEASEDYYERQQEYQRMQGWNP